MSELNRGEGPRAGVALGGPMAAAVLHEVELWTSAHCELASGMGAPWADWARRQREAIDVSARSL
jgi:hypothetical protein